MLSAKLSPAFTPFLEDSGNDDKRDALILYKDPSYRPGQRLSRSTIPDRAAAQAHLEAGIFDRYRDRTRNLGYALASQTVGPGSLPMAWVEVSRNSLAALAEDPEVLAILPNQPIHLLQPHRTTYRAMAPGERETGYTWGLRALDIPKLWETTQGQGVTVAVLDSGVHADHPALKDRVKNFVVIDPLGRRIQADRPFDAGRHGTHVCGTIAGGQALSSSGPSTAIGVAPQASLVVGGVLVGTATLKTLLEGIAWAIEQDAQILNLSLGMPYYEPLFAKVLANLIEQYDLLPVVAIGNANHGNSSSPGNVANAFAVGAVEVSKQGLGVAFFSSGASLVVPIAAGQGAEGDRATAPDMTTPSPNATPEPTDPREPLPAKASQARTTLVSKPNIVAPGARIYSCIPPEQRADGLHEYSYMDGTSMAAPHVSGVAALLKAAHPDATARDLMRVLQETAARPGQQPADNRWGQGLVQPLKALAALRNDSLK